MRWRTICSLKLKWNGGKRVAARENNIGVGNMWYGGRSTLPINNDLKIGKKNNYCLKELVAI